LPEIAQVPTGLLRYKEATVKPSSLRCFGCSGEVVELSWREQRFLQNAEPSKRGLKAYECRSCRVVIFEDELVNGRFIPHFMLPSKRSLIPNIHLTSTI